MKRLVYIKHLFTCVFFLVGLCQIAQAKLFNHHSFSLANGLTVYVIKNALAPVVNVSLIYKVGTADDPRDQHGLSHFLEHMMFKGTKSVPKGELDRIILQQGGVYNAYTNADITCYTTDIAKDQLELILFIEADRMQNLALSQNDVESERKVVLEERAMRIENNPFGEAQEIYLRSLFWKHPYGIPPIGYSEHIHAYTYKSLTEHYKTYYAPNNAILIITGDVNLEDMQKVVTKYFEKIPRRAVPNRQRQEEPPHDGTTVYVEHKAPRGRLISVHMSYFAPHYHHKEFGHHVIPGLVLAHILAGNELSRLHRLFVEEKQIAASLSSDYMVESIDPRSFNLTMTLNEGVNADEATESLLAAVQSVLEKGISEHELMQAKRDMLANLAFLRDGIEQSVAMFSAVAYDIPVDAIETWDDKIKEVTAEQVMKAANHILNKPPAVILTIYPHAYQKPIKDVALSKDSSVESDEFDHHTTVKDNGKLSSQTLPSIDQIVNSIKQLWSWAMSVVDFVRHGMLEFLSAKE